MEVQKRDELSGMSTLTVCPASAERQDIESAFITALLRAMVLDMFDARRNCSPDQDALCGQVVGFFSVLESWLEAATKHLDGELGKMDTKDLLKAANAGLNPDYEPEWTFDDTEAKA